MMDASVLLERLAKAVIATPTEDGVRVTTHCLYPSNSAVSVLVRGGSDEFMVSDEGGALGELAASGLRDRVTDRQIRAFVKPQGLKVSDGAIYSPVVSLRAAPAAILLVANASKEIADWGLTRSRIAPSRDFKRDLTLLLERHFQDNLKHDAHVIGASNKQHKFGHVIYLPRERRLLVDPVVPDPSSVNARVVANLDVRHAKDPSILQLIVYDDAYSWSSSDLNLLHVGAPTVPFSRAEEAITRLAA